MSDEQIQAWADEAEAGYDLQRRPVRLLGGPQSGEGLARSRLSGSTRRFLPHC